MKVEVWSDFVCPYCYLGKRRFEAALQQFEHKDAVELVFRSFELDPEIEVEGNPPIREMLASKYGMNEEQVDANIKSITDQAAELGLDFRMDQAVRTNTFDAHRLSHFAREKGKGNEMADALFKAHFSDGLHIGRHDVLADLAEKVGLSRDEALDALSGDAYAYDVRTDEQQAQAIGVAGVPFFVINNKYVVRGAHPSETFLGALQKAWDEIDQQTR